MSATNGPNRRDAKIEGGDMAKVVQRADELDARRRQQIANQTQTINGLKDQLLETRAAYHGAQMAIAALMLQTGEGRVVVSRKNLVEANVQNLTTNITADGDLVITAKKEI